MLPILHCLTLYQLTKTPKNIKSIGRKAYWVFKVNIASQIKYGQMLPWKAKLSRGHGSPNRKVGKGSLIDRQKEMQHNKGQGIGLPKPN